MGPKISKVQLPNEPFSGIEKVSIEEFEESGIMTAIARDVRKDSWPIWLGKLIQNASRAQTYPILMKEKFNCFINNILQL